MKHVVYSFALLGLLSSACIPPSGNFDPENPAAVSAQINGSVSLWLDDEPAADISGHNIEVIISGQVVVPDSDGSFSLTVPQGVYSVFARGTGLTSSDVRGPKELAPGRVWNLSEAFDDDDKLFGPLPLYDELAPSPPFLAPPPAVTTEATIELEVLGVGEDDGVLDSVLVQVNGVTDNAWLAHPIDSETIAVTLQPDQLNTIAFHTKDGRGNHSETQYLFTRHDGTPPTTPQVTLVPGSASLDVFWTPGDEDLDLDDDVVPDVAYYDVHYGIEADAENGNTANEGVSPIRVTGQEKIRLTGLNNGQQLFVKVIAYDEAGLSTADETTSATVHSATPNIVTPQTVLDVDLSDDAITAVSDTQVTYILLNDGTIDLRANTDGRQLGTINAGPRAADLAVYGHRLFVTQGADGLEVFDVTDPANVPGSYTLPLTPGGAGQQAVGIAIQLGQAFMSVRGPGGGIWRVNIAVGDTAPTHIAFNPINAAATVSGLSLHGALVANGRYLASQYYFSDVDADGNDISSGDHIVIFDIESGDDGTDAQVCRWVAPTNNNEFVHIFAENGDGTVVNPDSADDAVRKQFHFVGDYLAVPYDGAALLLRTNLGGACLPTGVVRAEAADMAVGSFSLGLSSAHAVQMLGAHMVVASRARITDTLGGSPLLPPRVDIVSLGDRQDNAGSDTGTLAALPSQGAVPGLDMTAGIIARGPHAYGIGTTFSALELFTPRALSQISAAGDNPTGRVVGMGPYLIHQRTLRGIANWDVTRPDAPVLQSNATCVPGCFNNQDLAGTPKIEGGVLVGAYNGADDQQTSMIIVDVGSDISQPVDRQSANNPCLQDGGSGDARGLAFYGRYLLIGCASESRVYFIDQAQGATALPASVSLASNIAIDTQLVTEVRDLATARLPLAGGTTQIFLLVLGANGQVIAYDLPTAFSVTNDLLPSNGLIPPTGLDRGERMTLDGDYLYILGETDCLGGAVCANTEERVARLHLPTLTFEGSTETANAGETTPIYAYDEATAHIEVYRDLSLLGRASIDNRYEARRDFFTAPMAIASPNPLPLHASIWGAHMYSASLVVYALE